MRVCDKSHTRAPKPALLPGPYGPNKEKTMLRHMIHGTIVVAEITTHAAISDTQAATWLLAGTIATLLISAYSLARDCSADLFAPPNVTTIKAG